MFGITFPFFCRKENLQSMIKLRFGVSGVEILWCLWSFSSDSTGKPSFRNFPSFVCEKPEHENLPKQLTAFRKIQLVVYYQCYVPIG